MLPCNLPISESSDSLSPEVVMPTAPATELEAVEKTKEHSASYVNYDVIRKSFGLPVI